MSRWPMLVTTNIDLLDYDPHASYKFNFYSMYLCITQMPVAVILFTFWPHLWYVFLSIFVIEALLWLTVCYHYGSMNSALAIKHLDNQLQIIKHNQKKVL